MGTFYLLVIIAIKKSRYQSIGNIGSGVFLMMIERNILNFSKILSLKMMFNYIIVLVHHHHWFEP